MNKSYLASGIFQGLLIVGALAIAFSQDDKYDLFDHYPAEPLLAEVTIDT